MLKLGLSMAALYLVFRRIDIPQLTAAAAGTDWTWLAPALLLFNLSKLLSAVRLNMLFGNAGVTLGHTENIKLYYTGMFYNLFLPGGIGGDGYKVYLLKRSYSTPLKQLISAVLYDRINGVAALGCMAGLLGAALVPKYGLILLAGGMLAFPFLWILTRLVFSRFLPSFFQGNLYSAGVQVAQVLSVICILQVLRMDVTEYMPYVLLFLVSSIAAALPISVGGIGARELVFVYGAMYLGTEMAAGVVISMIFFLITALSSFAGVFFPAERILKKQVAQ